MFIFKRELICIFIFSHWYINHYGTLIETLIQVESVLALDNRFLNISQ